MPSRHVRWSDASGGLQYAGWELGSPAASVDPFGLLAYSGTPRLRRGSLASADLRPRLEALSAHHRTDPDDVCDAYALVDLRSDGQGTIARDPLGIQPLYVASVAGATIVGNRADLVAEVRSRVEGQDPRRDHRAAVWLAFAGFVMNDATGFIGVDRLPQDGMLRVSSGAVENVALPSVWEASGPADVDFTEDDAIDEVRADIASALHHVVDDTAQRPQLELTGGKDSRLVLAVAAGEGLVSAFDLVTYGAADLADMRVARDVAIAVKGRHVDISAEHYAPAAAYAQTDRFRRHVHRSSGLSFLGDANEPSLNRGHFTSGLLGEVFRTANRHEREHPAATTAEAVARYRNLRPLGQLGLLRPVQQELLAERSARMFADANERLAGPADLRATHFVRRRIPGWQSPLADHHTDRTLPFYSPGAFRLAFRAGARARAEEVFHVEIIRRTCPALLDLPLAGAGWNLQPAPRRPFAGTGSAKFGASSESGSLPATLRDLLHARPDNPAFEYFERANLEAEIDGIADLDALDRRQLLGAMAGVVWMGELEVSSAG